MEEYSGSFKCLILEIFGLDSLLFGLTEDCKLSITPYQIGMVAFYKQLVEQIAEQEESDSKINARL